MRGLVRTGKKSLPVREKAVEITRDLPNKDNLSELRALHQWVKDNIRYVRDVRGIETLTTPETLLDIRAGDCDDHATLLASLAESIGYPTRFVAIGRPLSGYSHVFSEAFNRGQWVPMETTESVELGWLPPGKWRRLEMRN